MRSSLTPQKLAVSILLIGVIWTGFELYEFRTETLDKLEQERSQLEGQLTQKKNELKRLRNFAQNLEQIKQELRDLTSQLESGLESMPRTFNLAGLLRRVSMVAQNSGVDLSSFRPRPDTTTTSPAPPPTAPTAPGAAVAANAANDARAPATQNMGRTSFYSTVRIDFAIQGSFTQTLMFLDQLTRLKRIVNIESVRMRPQTAVKEAGRGGAVSVASEITMKTYRVAD